MDQQKPLPTFPVNYEKIRTIFGVYAGLRQLEKLGELMAKQISIIPNGKRDYKMLLVVGKKLAQNICDTVPEDKRDAIKRQAKHSQFDIQLKPRLSMVEKTEVVVDAKEMNTVIYYAHEQCKMCFDQDCKRCKLGKTLDRMLTYDREGVSWASVDLSCLNE